MLSTNTVSPHIIPPLKNGDRLTRPEFERRYQAMTQLKKAELIAGVVYMAAAVRAKNHGKPHANIIGWLTAYEVATPGVETLDNTTVRLDGLFWFSCVNFCYELKQANSLSRRCSKLVNP